MQEEGLAKVGAIVVSTLLGAALGHQLRTLLSTLLYQNIHQLGFGKQYW